MNLNEFIFLTEGLLKIPPVLSQEIKDHGLNVLIQHTLKRTKAKIKNIEYNLNTLRDGFDQEQVEELIEYTNQLIKLLENKVPVREPVDDSMPNKWKLTRRIPPTREDNYILYNSPDGKPEFLRSITVKKYYSHDSDEVEWEITLTGSNNNRKREYRFNDYDNKIRNYDLLSLFESGLDTTDYRDMLKQDLDEFQKFQTTLEKTYESKFIKNKQYKEFDVYDWGSGYEKTLTSEMFVGFNDSGVQTDVINNITQGNHVIKVDFRYRKYKDEKLPRNGSFYDPYISGNLVIYVLEIYVPWVDVEDNNQNWNYSDAVRELYRIIDHELGHFIQEIGVVRFQTKLTDPNRKFGYPPRKLLNKVPGTKTQIDPEFKAGNWAHPHELRDTEFYTRLRDTKVRIEYYLIDPANNKSNRDPFNENIGKFRIMVGLDPRKYTDGYYPSYQEPDYWLGYLKKNDPGKWNKAVKELYKELKSYLVKPKNYQY